MASVMSAQTLNYFDNLYCRWAHQIKANYHGNLTDRESYEFEMDQPKRRIAQQGPVDLLGTEFAFAVVFVYNLFENCQYGH
jgi:hypothetical protein